MPENHVLETNVYRIKIVLQLNSNLTISCDFHLFVHSFFLSVFFRGIWGTGEVRTADMLGSEVSGTHIGEYL